MAVGTVLAKIILDEPRKVHYGSSEPVKGRVQLIYTPSTKTRTESNPELFGPLELSVKFHGRCKSKVWKQSGQTTHIYRGRTPLFSKVVKIYDDSYKTKPNEPHHFPFELYFPEVSSNTGIFWDEDPRFAHKPGDPLPPSFSNAYRGFANHYESFVEYRVGVNVNMPRLQLIIAKPEKYDEPLVKYDRPRLPAPIRESLRPIRGREEVQNEFLLPEADRPSGFRQKSKAFFSTNFYPTYGFHWTITGPHHLYLGQPLAFEVNIKPIESSTAVLIPEVKLQHFGVEIKAVTQVRAERQLFSSPEAHSDEIKISMRGMLDDAGPFSKANDWTKIVNTRELRDVCSSFKTYNIAQTYKMRIRGAFTLAEKVKEFDIERAVAIHPALANTSSGGGQGSSSAAAGSSSRPLGMESVEVALPEYDRPPEYEEAVDEAAQSAVQGKKETTV